jgi:porin
LLLTLITAIPRQLQAQIVADRQLAAAIMLPSSSDSTEIKPASPVPLPRNPWGSWPYATGDWGGLRSRLTEHGLQFSGAYTYDVSHGVRGGVRRGSIGRGLLDFGVTADLKPLAGLRGGTLFAGFFLHGGANGSDLTGDIQAYSNVDAERFSRLAEVWYEQRLFGDRARLKLGQVDANSEFAAIASAGEFINASAGFSPTIYALPTYPAPTPSVNLFLQPSGWLSIGAGLYRGSLVSTLRPGAEADAAFGIGEIAGVWAEQGRVAFGYWRHQGYAPVFGGGMQRAPQGWYATFEQRLSGIAATDSTPARGLTFLAKFGSADERVSDFAHHAMVGVVAESPFGVAGHGAGVMVSAVDLSDVAAAGYSRNETSLEAFYRWPALGFLTLRPDVQYIVAPSGATGVADAVVGTLRAELAF